MIRLTIDDRSPEKCEIELDVENIDILRDDVLSLSYNLTAAIANTAADNSAAQLQLVLLVKSMLEMGAQHALDMLAGTAPE